MKELYIAPELEILCFAPMEGIAGLAEPTLPGSNKSMNVSIPEDTGYVEETYPDY